MAEAKRDQNHVTTALFESSTTPGLTLNGRIEEATGRILTTGGGSGSGTVTSFSFNDANGFDGTVTNATTTPELTLTTTITNGALIKSNSGALAAAVAGTDYTSLAFKTIAVSGQSDVVADSPEDTLTLVAGTNITLTTNAGADSVTINASGGSSGITIGTTTITSGTNTRILYDNSGVVGEYTITGTGTVVAMQTSPTFVTDITTPIAKLSATSNQLVFQSGGVTGTFTWTPTTTNKTVTVPDRSFTLDNITTATTTNGTGFLKGNGTVISFDNSTYLTTLTVGSTTITSGTTTRILYDNAGVLGEYTITGTGTVVAMATSPTFITGITTPQVLATANDSGALGASGTAFSDLFLASGGVINWVAGDYTLTHSSGVLTANKDLRITTPGTNSASVPSISSTNTFTNKTIIDTTNVVEEITTTASSSTPTPTGGSLRNFFTVTALATGATFAAPSGTPANANRLVIRIKDSGSGQTLAWNAIYRAIGVTLPTSIAASKTIYVGAMYNSADSKWDVNAVATEA